MPNYTTTTIKVPEKYWDKLKELLDVKQEKPYDYSIDFNRLAPIHPDLLKTLSGSGSYRTDDIRGFFEEQLKFQNEVANPIFEELYNDTITRSEFVEASVKALYKDKDITDLVTKILGCLENVQTFIEATSTYEDTVLWTGTKQDVPCGVLSGMHATCLSTKMHM